MSTPESATRTAAGTAPGLSRYDAAGSPRAALLLLHGGRPSSSRPVDGRSASWQLMRGLQRRLAPPALELGVSVWALRYRVRGWNGGAAPVEDAHWALDGLRRELGDVPVVLLGHSMGGRVSVHAAAHPSVVGVVALAPWFTDETPVTGLAGRHLVAAHGRHDRITSYAHTRHLVDRASRVARSARFVDMGPLGHYLIRGRRRWADVATTEALRMAVPDASGGGDSEISGGRE